MRRPGLTLALLFLSLGVSLGQRAPSGPTWLHSRLLDRSQVIVRARFLSTQTLPPTGIKATRFQILEVLKGRADATILVAGMGERATLFPRIDKLLFLDPMKSGRIHRLVDMVDLIPREAKERVELIKAYLALPRAQRNQQDAAKFSRRMAFRGLGMDSAFCRRSGAREFRWLVRTHPSSLQLTDLRGAERYLTRVPRGEQASYSGAIDLLRYHLAGPFGVAAKNFLRAETRRAYLDDAALFRHASSLEQKLGLLDRMGPRYGVRLRTFFRTLLADLDPKVADRAAFYLGEMADAPSVPRLVHSLGSGGLASRRVRIEALGKIGSASALEALVAQAGNEKLANEVWVAVARIGGGRARAILNSRRERAKRAGDPASAARFEYLQSERFRKAEELRQQRARGRYGIGGS